MDSSSKKKMLCKRYPHNACRRRIQVLFALIVCFALCALWQPEKVLAQGIGSSEGVMVDSVQVEGNLRVETEAILAVIKTEKGDRLNQNQLDQDLRDVYRMKFFSDAKIELKDGPNGKIVVFKVTEKPSIGEIAFNGNDKIHKDKLKDEIGLKIYAILDDNAIKQSINRLVDYYKERGYYNVKIDYETKPRPNNEVTLQYNISEEDKVYVKYIDFAGNNKFSDKQLRKLMESKKKGLFSLFTSSGVLDKKKLEYDLFKLTSHYHNNGFIQARVGEPQITYDEERKGLVITIEVHEGEQYNVGKVSIEGDLIQPESELLEKVNLKEQEVFSRETLRNDVNAVRAIYVDKGYAYAEVSPKSSQDDEHHLVDVTFVVSKGSMVRFERINIIGNTVTRDKVIRRELKTIEGEEYSGQALTKSKENLDRLGFFEDVELNTQKGSRDDLMVMDVKVKEKPTGSFSIGAGYSSEDSVFGIFQIGQTNLFGRGQRLEASAKLGGLSTQFNVDFTEPWLFDTRFSGNIALYKWDQEYEDYEYEGVDYEEYTRDSQGLVLGVGYPIDKIDEYTRGSVSYNYDNSDIGNVPDNAAIEWKDMEGQNITSSVILGIRRDTRDKPWDTHKGSVNSLSYEFAGLGGDVNFNKYLATSAWYFPSFWDTVFLVRGNWGYVAEHSGGKLPVYQKFRLGGLNTVRGFEYGDISPTERVPLYDPLGNVTGYRDDPVGGEKMMYYTLEYRFPVIKQHGIVGLVFFDAGNVYTDDESYSFSGIRKAAGCGVRWYSPMGPLRLEWGKNLDPEGDEKGSKFEFSVGGAF